MRVSIIPAQITTVEDLIAGNLSLLQVFLLAGALFISCMLFVVLPPFFHAAAYKLTVIVIIALLICVLAVRLRGKLLLLWCLVWVHYYLRPRYYLFDKRTIVGRVIAAPPYPSPSPSAETANPLPRQPLALDETEKLILSSLLKDPEKSVWFEHRKGGMYVHITPSKKKN